jgi:hypothetical protein
MSIEQAAKYLLSLRVNAAPVLMPRPRPPQSCGGETAILITSKSTGAYSRDARIKLKSLYPALYLIQATSTRSHN